ncbi:MAG: SurA N-terminal domain-containing protein [Anaerolineales bacterium]|nr:SurA N-terminal domain-containing protein [Anaerolineales bacterium]
MSEHNRKAQQSVQEQTELTRKQQLLQHRDREKHKKLFILLGSLLGLALLFVIIGVVYQFFILPNSAAAKVGNVTLTAADFQKRARYEKTVLESQLQRYLALQQQFGDSSGGFLEAQISQIQSTLASPFSIANQALDGMIEDVVIADEAAKRGITVSDAEIDQALREEIANGQGLVTESQAQATATAAVDATATAAVWTPTPVPTVDPSAVVTATATEIATPLPQPPAAVMSDTAYTEGLSQLEKAALSPVGMSLVDYRKIIGARLMREKLSTAIGQEQVKDTEEQVKASHILLTVEEPQVPISGTETISDVIASLADAATQALSETVGVSGTQALSETIGVTGTNAITSAVAAINNVVTKTVAAAATSALSETASITETANLSDTAETGSRFLSRCGGVCTGAGSGNTRQR